MRIVRHSKNIQDQHIHVINTEKNILNCDILLQYIATKQYVIATLF